ncbi:pluviatolide O-methyltransferase-like [Elaeis guineensis]|uniref:pluviatolide O-methyltransferase-like n=1 Tax=Elaeis guineensis var. tenera TaxID=51953 RepID=UPI003C6CECF7
MSGILPNNATDNGKHGSQKMIDGIKKVGAHDFGRDHKQRMKSGKCSGGTKCHSSGRDTGFNPNNLVTAELVTAELLEMAFAGLKHRYGDRLISPLESAAVFIPQSNPISPQRTTYFISPTYFNKQESKDGKSTEIAHAAPYLFLSEETCRELHHQELARHGADHDSSGEDAYSLTPSSQLLVRSCPTSLASYVIGFLDSRMLSPLQLLSAWYRSEQSATVAEMARGMPVWKWARANPDFNVLFNEATASDTSVVAKVVVTDCKAAFHGLRSLVDVGGGNGMFARAIAEAFPHIKCTVYDLPHVVATIPKSSAVEAIGGDMFEHIPSADAVFLKLIMHMLTEEQCVKILRRCKDPIPKREEGGKGIIVDMVLNSEKEDYMVTEAQLVSDLVVLQATGGKEREEHEWKKICMEAGFVDCRVTPLGARSLIEVFP